MKLFARFLLLVLCVMPSVAPANVATTAGSNLTAWNGSSGSTNNNNWNQLMNSRTQATGVAGGAPTADFGNCNSLILRCAQPKCAGCTSIDIAWPIVQGCVNSNSSCKKHGDSLIQFIAAQIVSSISAKSNEQQLMAAQAAAAQSSEQMAQMQMQMQQMQMQMQEQSAQQMAQMQAALDEQRRVTESAMNEANNAIQQQAAARAQAEAAQNDMGVTDADLAAIDRDVGADILARKKISNQILEKIDQAETALKSLKSTMDDIFAYAGCDNRGNNCAGPKRVKIFKQKAQGFFEPYEQIVDSAYEGLEMALAVGVDVSDVIMMLSGACNQWGKFLCPAIQSEGENGHSAGYYDEKNCKNGRSLKGATITQKLNDGNTVASGVVKGGMECAIGMAIPPQDDSRCTLIGLIENDTGVGEEGGCTGVCREWLDVSYEGDKLVRVGCATSALESISIFGRRTSRTGNSLDLEVLQRLVNQDAPDYVGGNRYTRGGSDPKVDRVKYCALTSRGYQTLLNAVNNRKLPSKVCVPYDSLAVNFRSDGIVSSLGSGTGIFETGIISGINKESCEYIKGIYPACGIRWVDSRAFEGGEVQGGRCMLEPKACEYSGGTIKILTDKKTKEEEDASWWYERAYNCSQSGGSWIADVQDVDRSWEGMCDCGSGKVMDGNGRCVAVSYTESRQLCVGSGGRWNDDTHVCSCNGINKNFYGGSCYSQKGYNCVTTGGTYLGSKCECGSGKKTDRQGKCVSK